MLPRYIASMIGMNFRFRVAGGVDFPLQVGTFSKGILFTCLLGVGKSGDEAAASIVAAESISWSRPDPRQRGNVKHTPHELMPEFVELVKPTGLNAGRWTARSGGRYQPGEMTLWTNWPIGGRN